MRESWSSRNPEFITFGICKRHFCASPYLRTWHAIHHRETVTSDGNKVKQFIKPVLFFSLSQQPIFGPGIDFMQ